MIFDPDRAERKKSSALAQYSDGTIGRITAEALLNIAGIRKTDAKELLDACEPARRANSAANFDHKYEPGPYGVCERCGMEKH